MVDKRTAMLGRTKKEENKMTDKEYVEAVSNFLETVLKQAGVLVLNFREVNELAMETTRRQRELEKSERTEK